MGIENFDELKELGLLEVLARGLEALPSGPRAPESAEKLGAATGELLGTIMLERRMVPAGISRSSKGLTGDPAAKAARGALAGGTWRALWQFAIHPFEDLGGVPSTLKGALEDDRAAKRFTLKDRRDSGYAGCFVGLLDDEEQVARRLIRLAQIADLPDKLDKLLVSAADPGKPPPDLEQPFKGEDPDWPGEAILFVVLCWLRLGLREILQGFAKLEDDTLRRQVQALGPARRRRLRRRPRR